MGKFKDDIYGVLGPERDDFETNPTRQGTVWDWAEFNDITILNWWTQRNKCLKVSFDDQAILAGSKFIFQVKASI